MMSMVPNSINGLFEGIYSHPVWTSCVIAFILIILLKHPKIDTQGKATLVYWVGINYVIHVYYWLLVDLLKSFP